MNCFFHFLLYFHEALLVYNNPGNVNFKIVLKMFLKAVVKVCFGHFSMSICGGT